VIDGNRITTAGGTASIDLMLKIIADDMARTWPTWSPIS
jgi:transcriptional regulator GlxA family with amidase domain